MFVVYFISLIVSIVFVVYSIYVLEDLEFGYKRLVQEDSERYSINSVTVEEALNISIVDVRRTSLVARSFLFCGLTWNNSLWRKRMLSALYPLLAGMIGSITLLSAKAAAEMVSEASTGHSEFSKGSAYLFFAIVGILGAIQIHILNLGLKKFDQIVVIPVFTVSLETFSVVISVIFFQDYLFFTIFQSIFFPLSILVTYIGVYVTAVGQSNRDSEPLSSTHGSTTDMETTAIVASVPAQKKLRVIERSDLRTEVITKESIVAYQQL